MHSEVHVFPRNFRVLRFFLVVKGSHTDLHRFDPRRPYSIKTRIKTLPPRGEPIGSDGLADHIPLKQGLRLFYSLYCGSSRDARRPYSIKTRIKTHWRTPADPHREDPRRPYSIKTRIKTLSSVARRAVLMAARRPYSIKTRIKTEKAFECFARIQTHLADHIPLKQGLRLSLSRLLGVTPRRPYSIKTRIKTMYVDRTRVKDRGSRRPYSIKTRIKTLHSLPAVQIYDLSQTIFH